MVVLIKEEAAMRILAGVLVALLAVEHVWIMIVEMFLWTQPYGLRAFGNTAEKAEIMAVLAKNQGLYNGFLAAGLFFGLSLGGGLEGWRIKVFFAACVLVAGIYGGITTGKSSILILQAVPALATLVALFVARPAA
jgi:putative membrane protein